jgi:hypothetical protein
MNFTLRMSWRTLELDGLNMLLYTVLGYVIYLNMSIFPQLAGFYDGQIFL